MPNIATALKSEIARLSAKVVRQHVAPIQSATQAQRKQLSALRKQVQQLEHEIAQLRRVSQAVASAENDDEGARIRFSAKGLRSLRKRLGLSAEDFGRLIPVSAQTVYHWEVRRESLRRFFLVAQSHVDDCRPCCAL